MFYITYYAKKHGKFITRKGQYDKPDGTKGKSFVSKKLVALENLNENENISYVVVNDGTPIK